jgi:hypothetical protein
VSNIRSDYYDELNEMKSEYVKKLYSKLESTDESKLQVGIIKSITKNNSKIPELEKYLRSYDDDVQFEAYKNMFTFEDIFSYSKYFKKAFESKNDKVRKFAFTWYSENVLGDKNTSFDTLSKDGVFNLFLKEYKTNNQIAFVRSIIKNADEDDISKLMELTKDKINSEAYSLFELQDNAKKILNDTNSPKVEIKEACEYLTINLEYENLLELLKNLKNPIARRELSKNMYRNVGSFSLYETNKFLDEEKDLDVVLNLLKISKKLYKSAGLEVKFLDRLMNSNYSRHQINAFKFAIVKDYMNYIDYARKILLNSTDENLIYAAAKYMLNFGDHVLLQFVKEFLKSKSKKLRSLAVDIVKKLKLESEDVEIFRIASDKKSNIPLRKKALNVLMEFKAEHLSKVFREIAFDDEEDLSLRELALKGVLYFNPEYIKK